MTIIMRPSSKAVLNPLTGTLDLTWDRFFNDVQITLNNNKSSITSIQMNASFTMDAATSKTISDARVTSASHIGLTATNAAAANLMSGSAALYVSARTAGVSFTVTAASGSAAGTETFSYSVIG